jgi:N-acetylmuramoyl-L-alanine amidase
MFAPMVALGNGVPDSATTLSTTSFQDDSTPAEKTTTEEDVTEDEPASSTLPWQQPIDYGVVVDNSNAPLPADGLACRVAPNGSAEDITRLFVGQSVEVTGESTWAEGIEFLPINCAGQGGYVKAAYVQLNSENVVEEVEVEVVEEAVEEEVAEEPAADEAVEEEAAVEDAAPVAGDLIVTVTDQYGQSVPDVCFDLYSVDGWVASSCDANDAIPGNGNSGFFGVPSGAYTVVATSAPSGVVIENHEAWVDAGATSSVSVLATAPEAPAAAPSEAVTEEVVAEEVVTEEATAVPTEVATEAPAGVVTEEAADAAVEPAASPTVEVTEEANVEEGEPATEAVTEVATVEASAEATEVPATEAVTEEPAATEAPAGPDLSKAIGDATVTGTNGEGVRCRVAPDVNSATIVVLAEGTTVYVLEAPANGFIGVACGNQLGYVDVNYMWAGGAGDEIPASAGSVVVVGTGGMSLNCRSGPGTSYPVIATVPMGSTLTSRGASANGWAPVVCGGKNGYVSIAYVEVTGGSTSTPTTGTSTGTGTTGTVTNTGGDTLNCRTSPGGSIITRLPQGTVLSVRGAASNGWVPVVCGGMNGYVSAQYFTIGGSSTGTTPTPTTTPGTGTTTGYVKVTGTGGGSLNCRSAASLSGMVISVVPYGATLAVRGAAVNGWTPVNCGGKNGYVSSQYVTPTSGSGTTNPTPTPTAPGSGGSGTATVVNTSGDGLRCRTSPGGSVITTVAEGTTVTTRGASSNGWTPVICAGQNGYMSSAYLSTGGGSGTTPTPTPTTPSSGSGIASGDHVRVDSSSNMRYEASLNANIVMVVPAGEVLLARGGVTNNFIPVDYDGLRGYIHVDLLTETTAALSERGGSGNDPAPSPGTGTATGNSLVNFAMRYIGYPYVSATHGPSSFDCSGFTYWVVKNVLGRDIGTGLWTQTVAGTPVSRSSLQPGDLVFFQNTYKAGLSHVGIYIGNDQFVHAENENTGVRVSSLSSTYYSSRWYGAVRLT